MHVRRVAASIFLVLAAPVPAQPTGGPPGAAPPAAAAGQAPAAAHDPAARVAAQREAMARLSFLDGVWRGSASARTPAGRHTLVQTERVGPLLDGAVRIVEGRGYEADGSIGFNALGVIAFEPATGRYTITAWTGGRAGAFPLTVVDDGFVWEMPAGPGAIVRHTATVRDGRWHEVGERIVEGAAPVTTIELDLVRVGDTDWPGGGAVPMD